jgi:hypothetical protein
MIMGGIFDKDMTKNCICQVTIAEKSKTNLFCQMIKIIAFK